MSIRNRILIAMTLVVLADLLTATVSIAYYVRAAQYQARMTSASVRTRAASAASARLTEFIAETESYALAVSTRQAADEADAYSRLFGADKAARDAVDVLAAHSPAAAASEVRAGWLDTRKGAFTWLNAQAADAGSPTRLWLASDSTLNTDPHSNIPAPAYMSGLSTADMRQALRTRFDGLRDGTIRRAAEDAQRVADVAAAAEASARSLARDVTIGLALASLAIALASGVWIYRGIVRPLDQARRYADRVASGDLQAVFGTHRSDEIGHLTVAIEDMKEAVVRDLRAMQELAGSVLVTAEGVTQAARGALDAAAGHGAKTDARLIAEVAEVAARAETLSSLAEQMLEA